MTPDRARLRALGITAPQSHVLDSLAIYGGAQRDWARPMDIGARDGTHHTATLRALIGKKLVERRLRGSLLNQIRGRDVYNALSRIKRGRSAPRGSYVYRLTPAGWRTVRRKGSK